MSFTDNKETIEPLPCKVCGTMTQRVLIRSLAESNKFIRSVECPRGHRELDRVYEAQPSAECVSRDLALCDVCKEPSTKLYFRDMQWMCKKCSEVVK